MNNYRLMESYLFVLKVTTPNSYTFQRMDIIWSLLSLTEVPGVQSIMPET